MKKHLTAAAALFITLLAAITGIICHIENKPLKPGFGNFITAANETEQLIKSGNLAAAEQSANALKAALSEYNAYPTDSDNSFFLWIGFFVSSAVIIAVFLYIYFAVLRPFEKLTGFAERVAGGDFDLPLNYERTNYFGKFTWAFDCMRREISAARASEKAAVENNKTVIASLSHDIKTPVASIRAYTEGLEAGLDMNMELRAKYLSVIMRKCDEVAALTNDMLLHSVSDLDKLKIAPKKIELCEFIRETASELSVRNSIRLNLPPKEIFVNADKNRMVQVFENIVGNTMKYAKTDIDISVQKNNDSIEIAFRDYGCGVDESEIPFIFDKFYRGGHTGRENGAGLGLYIVKYIITNTGGECFAENLSDGFQIKIILPQIGDF